MAENSFPVGQCDWFIRVFHLAWPVILSSLSVPLVGLVDTAVMGQLPEPRFMAAVAVGAVIFSSIFWVFGFLRMGTTGFVAQAAGRGDYNEVSLALLRALGIAVLLGALVLVLQVPLGSIAFYLMGAGQEVSNSAQVYYDIRIWSAPATFVNYVVLGCLIGLQRMQAALLVQLVLNLSNILLDVLFVLHLGMETDGVALASLISEWLAMGIGLCLLQQPIRVILVLMRDDLQLLKLRLFDAEAFRALIKVNSDLFIRTLLLSAAFFFFTSQGARFGTVVLAANAILMNMLHMMAYGLDGFAHAAEALVGGAHGAGNQQAVRRAVKSSTQLALLVAMLVSVLYGLFGDFLITSMTSIDEVSMLARQYMFWVVVAPLIAVWSFQFDGIFIGLIETRAMRDTVGIALLVYVVLVLITVPLWGNHALWACMLVFLGLRGLLLGRLYPAKINNTGAEGRRHQ